MSNFKYYNQTDGQWEDIAVGVIDDGVNRYTPSDIKTINDQVIILQGLNPEQFIINLDAITVGNFYLPRNKVQLGTVTLA